MQQFFYDEQIRRFLLQTIIGILIIEITITGILIIEVTITGILITEITITGIFFTEPLNIRGATQHSRSH